MGAVLVLAGCGADKLRNSVVLTRDDGSRIEIDGPTRVDCNGERLHVMAGTRDPRHPRSFWELEVALRQVAGRNRFTFPRENVGGSAIFFAFDAATRNELSSSEEEAHGNVTFVKAACNAVDFSIDAHLGSEFFEQPGADARGRFRSP